MPEVVSLVRACVRGLPKYFTGEPCKYGHIAERYTNGSSCVVCSKKRKRNSEKERIARWRWKELNREKVKVQSRRWRLANPEKVREASRRWREKNLKEAQANYRNWREYNPEKNRDRIRRWYKLNPEKGRAYAGARRFRKINQSGIISPDIIDRLLEKQDYECAYSLHWCKVDFLFDRFHVDHIMPLALGGKHEDSNLQLLCVKCNMSKGAKHPDTFVMQELERQVKLRSSK